MLTILDDLAKVVSKAAPLLGGALGGPIGGVVGSLIGNLFGGTTANPQDLIQKINADPEAAIKLKTLEYQHQEFLQNTKLQAYQAENSDRASARDREIQEEKITGKKDWVPHALAIGFLIGMFIYLGIGYLVPKDFDKTIFNHLLNIAMLIYSFYFGSAYGHSRDKDNG